MTIRCVCFDWGGVLLRICKSWAEGCARAGVAPRPLAQDAAHAAERHRIAHDYQEGKLTCAEFLDRMHHATLGAYSRDEIRAVHDAWLIEEYPGVAELVADLHQVPGLTTGMLSNTNHMHWARQQSGGPGGPCFPTAGTLRHRHASHLLRAAKPDLAIYRAFERATGLAPGEILFFDDLADNIAAARAAGWNAEQIDPHGDTVAQMRRHLYRLGILRASTG